MPRKKSPRQEAIDEIVAGLERDMSSVQSTISQYKYRLNAINQEQTKLKRKRTELSRAINALKFNRGPDPEETT